MYSAPHRHCPPYISDMVQSVAISTYRQGLRSSTFPICVVPRTRTKLGDACVFSFRALGVEYTSSQYLQYYRPKTIQTAVEDLFLTMHLTSTRNFHWLCNTLLDDVYSVFQRTPNDCCIDNLLVTTLNIRLGAVRNLGFDRNQISTTPRPPQTRNAPTYQISVKSNARLSFWWFYKFLDPLFRRRFCSLNLVLGVAIEWTEPDIHQRSRRMF